MLEFLVPNNIYIIYLLSFNICIFQNNADISHNTITEFRLRFLCSFPFTLRLYPTWNVRSSYCVAQSLEIFSMCLSLPIPYSVKVKTVEQATLREV